MALRSCQVCEITHVPPSRIAEVSEKAKKLGAKIVVIHGETISEPVAPGTNHESIMCEFVDILAHPGFISEEVLNWLLTVGLFSR